MNILETTIKAQELFSGFELCRLQEQEAQVLADRLRSRKITIAVIGQFKRGKTTLINSILGSKLLPVGIVPITAAITRIEYAPDAAPGTPDAAPNGEAAAVDGETATATVFFTNGLSEQVPVSDLHEYISEQENHDNERGVAGVYANWDFYNCAVVDTAQVGEGHVVAMRNGSYFNTVENLNKIPKVVRISIYNPTSTGIMITPQYSINNGQRWKGLDVYPYDFYIPAGSSTVATITSFPTDKPMMMRIKQTSGSSSEYCFIDDIEICYEETWEPEFILGDVNDDGLVNIKDVTALINYLLNGDESLININAANVKEDDIVNIGDVTALINLLLKNS